MAATGTASGTKIQRQPQLRVEVRLTRASFDPTFAGLVALS